MIKTMLYKTGLDVLYYTGAFKPLRNLIFGVGGILSLHHVRPANGRRSFAPNGMLEITPDFLDAMIVKVRQLGYDIVSLDEFHRRLVERDFSVPCVSFTLDDGYEDNHRYAFPVFLKHEAPFAIYVCTGIIDGAARQWWRLLEEIVFAQDVVTVSIDGRMQNFDAATTKQKYLAFNEMYRALRKMPHDIQMATLDDLEGRYEHSAAASRKGNEGASWEMLGEMIDSGLLTIGAHTVTHDVLGKLSDSRVRQEMKGSRDRLKKELGVLPKHFAYPYGDAAAASCREFDIAKELGFNTAVTTRNGIVLPEHAEHLYALPRVPVNGNYQKLRYVDVTLSEFPFYLQRGMRRLDVD